jgi:hypothetical protein
MSQCFPIYLIVKDIYLFFEMVGLVVLNQCKPKESYIPD